MRVTTVLPTQNEERTINKVIPNLKELFASSDVSANFVIVGANSQGALVAHIVRKLIVLKATFK